MVVMVVVVHPPPVLVVVAVVVVVVVLSVAVVVVVVAMAVVVACDIPSTMYDELQITCSLFAAFQCLLCKHMYIQGLYSRIV
jgi:hypothetical protein